MRGSPGFFIQERTILRPRFLVFLAATSSSRGCGTTMSIADSSDMGVVERNPDNRRVTIMAASIVPCQGGEGTILPSSKTALMHSSDSGAPFGDSQSDHITHC
jgi:hypothetical protein